MTKQQPKYRNTREYLEGTYGKGSYSWNHFINNINPLNFIHLIQMTKDELKTYESMGGMEVQETYLQEIKHPMVNYIENTLNIDTIAARNECVVQGILEITIKYARRLSNFNWSQN